MDVQAGLGLCCLQATESGFFRVEAHMMLKPRLPGYVPDCDSNEYHEIIEN